MRAVALKYAILASAALLVSASSVSAEDWRVTGDNDWTVQAVDISSMRIADRLRSFWTVTIHAERQSSGEDYSILHQRIHCDAKTIQTLAWVKYTLGEPSPISSSQEPDKETAINPDTIDWDKQQAVCSNVFAQPLEVSSSRQLARIVRQILTDENP